LSHFAISDPGTTQEQAFIYGLTLEAGWSIGMKETDNVADASIWMRIVYKLEYVH